MPNGHYQIEYIIREAGERVAEKGRGADDTDLMLACFGYLAHEIQKPQWWSIKRVVPIAFAGGAAFGTGVLGGVLRLLGGA